jgi:hypothetical protein
MSTFFKRVDIEDRLGHRVPLFSLCSFTIYISITGEREEGSYTLDDTGSFKDLT